MIKRTLSRLSPTIATLAACTALAACDVDQTQEGKMPEVEVIEGQMPEYEVKGPDVKVGTELKEIEVPDVDVDVKTEKKVVEVPSVDVDMPEDD